MEEAIKSLLYKIADDELIIGHRNAEWTGIGPILEEDIAFSSMAQDKIGHALANYQILHEEFGEADPDRLGFGRKASDFRCCHLVELPTEDYGLATIRHFLFDHAELQRYKMLSESEFDTLANLAKKIWGELKYHVFHADTWVTEMAGGSEAAKARLQTALNEAYPLALGLFEPDKHDATLRKEKIFGGEAKLQKQWEAAIQPVIDKAGLKLPQVKDPKAAYGGRQGKHTEHLQPLLNEMGEVINTDLEVSW